MQYLKCPNAPMLPCKKLVMTDKTNNKTRIERKSFTEEIFYPTISVLESPIIKLSELKLSELLSSSPSKQLVLNKHVE